MLTLTDLWESFSTVELVGLALAWVASFGALAIAYVKTTRWDQAWKARWEQRHGASLETRRAPMQRTLKALTLFQWTMLALVFMSVGASFGPIVSVIKGWQREPALIVVVYAALNLLTLGCLALAVASVKLKKYQLKRIAELLAGSPRR